MRGQLNWICAAAVIFAAAECRGEADPVAELKQYLTQADSDLGKVVGQAFAARSLTREQSSAAAALLSEAHLERIRSERGEEMKRREISSGKLKMPFFYKTFGEKPEGGRRLFISLHGGGGAPVAVNDQQWRNQQRLYSPKEGVYLAPRAATNTWNLWHQGHIDGMFGRLIENLVAFEDVNPNRVYVMGYSAGGDGVYQLAPRMADQWAAAAMMAGHPNDSSPQSLRNIGFTLHVGGRDAAYNRNKVAAEWEKRLAALQKDDPGGYRHLVKIHSDKGHWMDREDRVAVPWMSKFARDPYPDRIVWRQDDVTHSRFYWLAVDDKNRQGRSLIIADRKAQTISLESEQIKQVKVRLHDDLIDLDKPIVIKTRDQVVFEGKPQRTIAVIATSLSERIDPGSVFTAEVTVSLAEK